MRARHYEIVPMEAVGPEARAEWGALVARLGRNPTLTPQWLEVSRAALARAEESMRILLGRDEGGALVSVVPHFVRRARVCGLPARVLHLGSNLMSYHAGFVTAEDSEAVLGALLERIAEWDVLYAANFLADGPDLAALRRWAREQGAPLLTLSSDASPFLRIERPWPEFVASFGKKFRYKLRKRSESFPARDGWRLEWIDRDGDVDRFLRDMLQIEKSSWKASQGTSVGSNSVEYGYHLRLLPLLRNEGMLHGAVLRCGDRPVAYSLCCRYAGWFGHLKTSFDEDFAALSPGAFVIDASIERAFETAATEFDFLGDAAPHKLAWTANVRPHVNAHLFAPRPLPRVLGRIKLGLAARRAPRAARAQASL